MTTPRWPVVLQAVMGSHAYGLAREGSDEDRQGVFVASAKEIAGLDWSSHHESHATHDPDATHHEARKYVRLALKSNPTVTELLWLPMEERPYEIIEWPGLILVNTRDAFVSAHYVLNAYAGYAHSQIDRMRRNADDPKRRAKNAWHTLRLLRQGRELLETANLTVRVHDPEEYWAFEEHSIETTMSILDRELRALRAAGDDPKLQEYPNTDRARYALSMIREWNP